MKQRRPLVLPTRSSSSPLLLVSAWLLLGWAGGVHAQGYDVLALTGTSPAGLFGISVAGLGDVDGDGIPDGLVGAPQYFEIPGFSNGPGYALLFSGATGGSVFTLTGTLLGDRFGQSVGRAGDVDGDGVEDLLVGAPGTDAGGLADSGRAFAISGSTGIPLLTLDGTAAGDFFGESVAGVGDIDGDGNSDFVVGAPRSIFPPVAAGYARLFSGAAGALLFQLNGTSAGDLFGASVAGPGDLSGDGVPDLLVGSAAPYPSLGVVRTFSGATGAPLLNLNGTSPGDPFRWTVAGGGSRRPRRRRDLRSPRRRAVVLPGRVGSCVLRSERGRPVHIQRNGRRGAARVLRLRCRRPRRGRGPRPPRRREAMGSSRRG